MRIVIDGDSALTHIPLPDCIDLIRAAALIKSIQSGNGIWVNAESPSITILIMPPSLLKLD